MKRKWIPIILSVFFLSSFLVPSVSPSRVYAETPSVEQNQTTTTASTDSTVNLNPTTQKLEKSLFGDKLTQVDSDSNYMNRLLAQAITAFPRWCISAFGLKDLNQLIFNQNNMKYGTFPSEIWGAADVFYQIVVNVSAYLLVIAILVWGFLILFRSGSPMAQGSIREMTQGILTYVCGIWLGGYLFEVIFWVNQLFVIWAMEGMKKFGLDVTQLDLLSMFLTIQNTNGLGQAILFFVMVFSIGMVNYQYALRVITLVILILLFPVCAYASIFPGSQKALDLWFREFNAQVFMNGGHALIFALFFVFMTLDASVWYLFAMMFGLPSLANLIRIIFGAPGGGRIGGGMGLGSMMAINQMVRTARGKNGSQPRPVQESMGGGSGGNGIGFANPALLKSNVMGMAKGFIGGVTTATIGSMVGGAMTGSPMTGMMGAQMAGRVGKGVKNYTQDRVTPHAKQVWDQGMQKMGLKSTPSSTGPKGIPVTMPMKTPRSNATQPRSNIGFPVTMPITTPMSSATQPQTTGGPNPTAINHQSHGGAPSTGGGSPQASTTPKGMPYQTVTNPSTGTRGNQPNVPQSVRQSPVNQGSVTPMNQNPVRSNHSQAAPIQGNRATQSATTNVSNGASTPPSSTGKKSNYQPQIIIDKPESPSK